MKKRMVSLLLALCLLLGMLPVAAAADPGFTDVSAKAWYAEAVSYVYDRGLMNGTGNGAFSPNETATRAMVVTILHRVARQPYAKVSEFADVSVGAWYANAVAWAAEKNIVNGMGGGLFAPDAKITRQQLAAILYRYAVYAGRDTSARANLRDFADADEVADYAVRAMEWAVGSGLMDGVDADTLAPTAAATRAQLAAMLMRFGGLADAEDTYDEIYRPNGSHPGYDKPDSTPDDEPADDPTVPPVEGPTEDKDYYNAAICGITVEADTVTVTMVPEQACTLTVKVLDEETEQPICTMETDVAAEDTAVDLPLEVSLPRYFIVTAQLFAADGTPLNNLYTCLDYTQGFAQFRSKTPADFPRDRVLPVQENGQGGFLVLSEDVVRLDAAAATVETGVYSFPAGTALSVGDKICFIDENGAYRAIRVSAAAQQDGAVIVTEDSTANISDLYAFIKIDASFQTSAQEPAPRMRAAYSLRASREESDDSGIFTGIELGPSISGRLVTSFGSLDASVQAGGDIKAYYDPEIWGDDYLQVDVLSKLKVEGDVVVGPTSDIKVEQELIPEVPLAGLEAIGQISLNLKGVINVNAQVGAGMHLSAEVGVGHTYNTKDGGQKYNYRNITPSDFHVDNNIEASVELEAGVRASLDASLLSDLVTLSIGAGAGLGAEGEIVVPLPPAVSSSENEHACDLCLDGRSYGYLNANLNLDYELSDRLRGDIFDLELARGEWTINRMYLSLINEAESVHKGQTAFGWGECPNRKYLTVVTCYDSQNVQKEGCPVEIVKTVSGNEITEDAGTSTFRTRLYPGSYTAKATIDTNKEAEGFTVTDGVALVRIYGTDCIVSGTVMGKEKKDEAEKPLSGASVVVLNEEGTATVSAVAAAQDGTYSLTLPGGSYKLSFRADGYDPAVYTLNDLQEDRSINPVLEGADKQGDLTGCVTSEQTGEPISGATVQIMQDGEIITAATTDENGQYSVELEEGDYIVKVSAENHKSDTVGAAVQAKETTILNVVLEASLFKLSGTVTAQDTGEVISGAVVTVSMGDLQTASAVTDEAGSYEVLLPKGEHSILIVAEGYGRYNCAVSVTDENITHDAALSPVKDSGSCGTWAYWTLSEDGVLTIYGSGSMKSNYDKYRIPWLVRGYRNEIKRVVVEEGITALSIESFSSCSQLTEVSLPETLETIGFSAFTYTGLKSLTIPGSVKEIGGYAFSYCEDLTNVDIAADSRLTTVGDYAFYHSNNFDEIFLPASIETIGRSAIRSSSSMTIYYGGTQAQFKEVLVWDYWTDIIGSHNDWRSASEAYKNCTVYYNRTGKTEPNDTAQ